METIEFTFTAAISEEAQYFLQQRAPNDPDKLRHHFLTVSVSDGRRNRVEDRMGEVVL